MSTPIPSPTPGTQWTPGQVTSLVLAVLALIAIVVLTLWADGQHVEGLLGLLLGLLAPSALPLRPRPAASSISEALRDPDSGETTRPVHIASTRRDRDRERGSASPAALVAILVGGALLLWLAAVLSGCGASALVQHARASSAASVAVVGAHDVIVATCQRAIDACGDVACVDEVHARCATAGSARDLTSEAVGAYADAIEIASIAGGEDPGVLATLGRAAGLALERWTTVAVALAPLGVELPSLFSAPAEGAGPAQTGGER
jgi:hypothetical protein